MTARTGNTVPVAIGISGTWATADTLGTNDKAIVDSIKFDKAPVELTEAGIGSGVDMPSDAQQGATKPAVTVAGTMYYDSAVNNLIAAFFNGESVTGNATSGYIHSFHHGGFPPSKFATVAANYALNSVVEAQTGTVTKLSIKASNPKNYLKYTADLITNDVKWTGSTNSFATVEAVTLADSTKAFCQTTDTVKIGGVTYAVTDFSVDLTKDQESPEEIKGASGNSSPVPTGSPPFQGTCSMTFRTLSEAQFFTQAASDLIFYCIATFTGSTNITGTSTPYLFELRLPGLKLIQDPQHDISSGGFNPLNLTFKVVQPLTLPAGMYTSYPHAILRNGKSAVYYA